MNDPETTLIIEVPAGGIRDAAPAIQRALEAGSALRCRVMIVPDDQTKRSAARKRQ
ncbi:MAG TPA: hypothetical protein VHS58_10150 [Acetobacteraceae bacterium]|jgi:hypothetical protein|nr:hypothetical protein [Acetobacteraceae bacterium]